MIQHKMNVALNFKIIGRIRLLKKSFKMIYHFNEQKSLILFIVTTNFFCDLILLFIYLSKSYSCYILINYKFY